MPRLGRLVSVCVLTALAMALAASGASATTFFVNGRTGSDTNNCRGKIPSEVCATIHKAIERSEEAKGTNTIEVSEETYEESITLAGAADKGLTIKGEEPGVLLVGKGSSTVTLGPGATGVTLSNLELRYASGANHVITDEGEGLTLVNDVVDDESGSSENGIQAKKAGLLTITGGKLEMEEAQGFAASAEETQLVVEGVTILTGAQSESHAGGIASNHSGLTVKSSQIHLGNNLTNSQLAGVFTTEDGLVTLQNDTIDQDGVALGLALEKSKIQAEDVKVTMEDSGSKNEAIGETSQGVNSIFSHIEVGGTWKGPAFLGIGTEAMISDSRLVDDPLFEAPVVEFLGFGEGRGLLVQRSVLQGSTTAKPATLAAINGNVTVDSSEILGGLSGGFLESKAATTQTLTVANSTIDAGAPGVAADAFGVKGVNVEAKTAASSVANANIEGSIVLEPQVALAAAGTSAAVTCSYSAVPSQTQAAKGNEGAIGCAAGGAGNTESNPIASLFSEPLSNYQLLATSSAVGSVPPSAITLPFGLTPSATDLAGNARTGDGTDACFTAQDRGALELQGHLLTCPVPASAPSAPAGPAGPAGPAKATLAALTALTISPSSFQAAPSGATIARVKTKRTYGAKVTYRDSQAATATFTVLREEQGRKQGHSCKKPSKANKHGKRCTLLTKVGTFTHTDTAGADSFHFSGRIHGKKLARGPYRLQALPSNAAGRGAPVSAGFKVR